MATSKVSRLLIIDLMRFISVFIREIYTFNVKQKHSAWAWSKEFSANALQFGANAVRSAHRLGKRNQKYSRHESTTHLARTQATEVARQFEMKWK